MVFQGNQKYGKGIRLLVLSVLTLLIGMMLAPSASAADSAVSSATIGSIKVVYGLLAVISLLLVVGCCGFIKRINTWFLLLYLSAFVVNLGYFALSISKTLEEALLANRISYLGSVFLPLCMLMIIGRCCRIKAPKWAVGILVCVSVATFLLAASGGYLDCYYKEARLEVVDGVVTLEKVYGPLHIWYLIYLLLYAGMMVGVIVYATLHNHNMSFKHAALLVCLALGNMMVWYVEQLIDSSFEFLSVTYIITELILLLLYQELEGDSNQRTFANRQEQAEAPPAAEIVPEIVPMAVQVPTTNSDRDEDNRTLTPLPEERVLQIMETCPELALLTAREREVLESLLRNKKRKEIAESLCVTENTVKKHTSNIFAKLNVSNRRELLLWLDEQTPTE